jgi:hypothetical protein
MRTMTLQNMYIVLPLVEDVSSDPLAVKRRGLSFNLSSKDRWVAIAALYHVTRTNSALSLIKILMYQ